MTKLDASETTISTLVDALENARAMAGLSRVLMGQATRIETTVDALIGCIPGLTTDKVQAAWEKQRKRWEEKERRRVQGREGR
jgi:hypothetical protein